MEISSIKAKELLGKEDVVFLDVRTLEEREQESITPSVHIDVFDAKLEDKLEELDKNKRYIVYCRSGNRSSQVTHFLRSKGYLAFNLSGGMLDWD